MSDISRKRKNQSILAQYGESEAVHLVFGTINASITNES